MKRTPLRRKTWMKRRRTTPRRSGRVSDPEHMKWVRKLPCAVRTNWLVTGWPPMVPTKCTGRVQADHAGPRPVSRKADDDTAIPLCKIHHSERTDFTGTFKGWPQARMRAWLETVIFATRHEIKLLRARLRTLGCDIRLTPNE